MGITKTKRDNGRKYLRIGLIWLAGFAVWTALILKVDVQTAGETGTTVGFATWNTWFHQITGVHMGIYTVTDWLGLVPVFVCIFFAGLGALQLVKRRSLFKVDRDILILGIYYLIVIVCYLTFEMIPVNYRPIFIDGRMEASYPSSTTLLVMSVMPTLVFQSDRRLKHQNGKQWIRILAQGFLAFMVIGRLISGVHWFTDIAGSALFSAGLFYLYKGIVLLEKIEKR